MLLEKFGLSLESDGNQILFAAQNAVLNERENSLKLVRSATGSVEKSSASPPRETQSLRMSNEASREERVRNAQHRQAQRDGLRETSVRREEEEGAYEADRGAIR